MENTKKWRVGGVPREDSIRTNDKLRNSHMHALQA